MFTFRISSFVVRLAIVTLLWMTGPIISLIALSKATSMILWISQVLSDEHKKLQCMISLYRETYLLYCNCGPRELSFSLILKYISARGIAAISCQEFIQGNKHTSILKLKEREGRAIEKKQVPTWLRENGDGDGVWGGATWVRLWEVTSSGMIKATLSSSTMLLEGRRMGAPYCTTKVLLSESKH